MGIGAKIHWGDGEQHTGNVGNAMAGVVGSQ